MKAWLSFLGFFSSLTVHPPALSLKLKDGLFLLWWKGSSIKGNVKATKGKKKPVLNIRNCKTNLQG